MGKMRILGRNGLQNVTDTRKSTGKKMQCQKTFCFINFRPSKKYQTELNF